MGCRRGAAAESERLLDTGTRTKGGVNIGKACIARDVVSRALIDRGWTPGGDGEVIVVSVSWPRREVGNMDWLKRRAGNVDAVRGVVGQLDVVRWKPADEAFHMTKF